MKKLSYPEVIKFKDSVLGSTALGIFMGLLSIIALWMDINTEVINQLEPKILTVAEVNELTSSYKLYPAPLPVIRD